MRPLARPDLGIGLRPMRRWRGPTDGLGGLRAASDPAEEHGDLGPSARPDLGRLVRPSGATYQPASGSKAAGGAARRGDLQDGQGRQLQGSHRDQAARGLADRLGGGVVRVLEHQRHAAVGLSAQRHRQGDLAEQGDVELVGQVLAAALAEDREALARRVW